MKEQLLYLLYGNAQPHLEAVRVRWVHRPSVVLVGSPYTCFIDVLVLSSEDTPVSNFCPALLLPTMLKLLISPASGADYSEEIPLLETSRLGRFAFNLHSKSAGRFYLRLLLSGTTAWSTELHISDSWSQTEHGDIVGSTIRARAAAAFFGLRVLLPKDEFTVTSPDPFYIGVADEAIRTKTWTVPVNAGKSRVEVADRQMRIHTTTDAGDEVRDVRVDIKTFVPYIKLKPNQTATFL